MASSMLSYFNASFIGKSKLHFHERRLEKSNRHKVLQGRRKVVAIYRQSGSSEGKRDSGVSSGNYMHNETAIESLRTLLHTPGLHQGPCAHDAISAALIRRAGFPFAFMSGFCVSAAKLAEPDAGLISYAEMVEQGAEICRAAGEVPVIGDGDTGYGNALNVKRTVRGYAAAGFAGILLEDQVAPKACGHTRNRRVVSRTEAVSRIRAAVDARDQGAGILITARTDSRAAVSLDEAIWRAQAFADEGADMVFCDALRSREEMQAFAKALPADVPKMANMLEGGGATPLCSLEELQDLGFRVVAYPLSLLGVSVRAMENALLSLKTGEIPVPPVLPTFEELKEVVGFPEYYAEEEKYAIKLEEIEPVSVPLPETLVEEPPKRTPYIGMESPSLPVIEPDILGDDGQPVMRKDTRRSGYASGYIQRQPTIQTNRWLSLKVTNMDGKVQLETRFPANFLGGLGMVPAVAGVDLKALLKDVLPQQGESWPENNGRTRLLDVTSKGQRIEVYLED